MTTDSSIRYYRQAHLEGRQGPREGHQHQRQGLQVLRVRHQDRRPHEDREERRDEDVQDRPEGMGEVGRQWFRFVSEVPEGALSSQPPLLGYRHGDEAGQGMNTVQIPEVVLNNLMNIQNSHNIYTVRHQVVSQVL